MVITAPRQQSAGRCALAEVSAEESAEERSISKG